MDKADFEDYLQNRYHDQIRWYDEKSLWNQQWFKRLQMGIVILAALTPMLIAVDFGFPHLWWFKFLPIATSVLVAIMAGALSIYKYQENWTNYRTICETLKKEIHLYKAGLGEYGSAEDREALFVERAENVISRENSLWLMTHGESGEQRH